MLAGSTIPGGRLVPADVAAASADADHAAALLAAAREGSVEALGRLFEAARVQLLAVATRDIPPKLRGKFGPSDLVQQTALDAHRGIVGFAGDSPEEFYGWLREILRTNIVDSVRRYEKSYKRDVEREVSLDDPDRGISVDAIAPLRRRPDDSAIRREEMLAVERALDALTPDRRAVVWMRHWEGRSFADIGERLGSSEAAVRKLWYRGIRQLGEVIRTMPAFVGEPSRHAVDDHP